MAKAEKKKLTGRNRDAARTYGLRGISLGIHSQFVAVLLGDDPLTVLLECPRLGVGLDGQHNVLIVAGLELNSRRRCYRQGILFVHIIVIVATDESPR